MFNYDQALVQARKLARGEANADTATAATGFAPITLGQALDAYEADLKARGGSIYNASGPRGHLSPQLLAKPVALLDAKELRKWRDGLLAKGLQPSSVVRYCKSLRAALNPRRVAGYSASRTPIYWKPDWSRRRMPPSPAMSSSTIATSVGLSPRVMIATLSSACSSMCSP